MKLIKRVIVLSLFANSGESDQTLCFATSDLGSIFYLPIPLNPPRWTSDGTPEYQVLRRLVETK